jgi:hypothetical protein
VFACPVLEQVLRETGPVCRSEYKLGSLRYEKRVIPGILRDAQCEKRAEDLPSFTGLSWGRNFNSPASTTASHC